MPVSYALVSNQASRNEQWLRWDSDHDKQPSRLIGNKTVVDLTVKAGKYL